jgi:ribokinase
MCGLLGAAVYFFGAVGADAYGLRHKYELKRRNVNIENLQTSTRATGSVVIYRTAGIKNIINYTGANYQLRFDDMEKGLRKLAKAGDFLIVQQEIQNEITEKVIEIGSEIGMRIVLNPAPASLLRKYIYKKVEFLIPNETEVKILTNEKSVDLAIRKLLKTGVKNVIVTLGENGAAFSSKAGGGIVSVGANKIKVVDTAGAGDAFIGSFITKINEGEKFKNAIIFAQKVASIVCTRYGTYENFPTLAEIKSL